MIDSETLKAQIDAFVDEYLQSVPEQNRLQAKFILDRLRTQFLGILDKGEFDVSTVEGLGGLCDHIEKKVRFYDSTILEKMGMPDLEKDVLGRRRAIKWQCFVGHLSQVLLPDLPFSPAIIKRLSPELFKAIETALRAESEDGRTVDWDRLADKLPEEMRTLYRSEIVDCTEKRRIIDEETKKTIERLELADVVSGLSQDPKKLAQFLDLSGLKLSDLEKSRIIYVSFAGLRSKTEGKLERLLRDCEPVLAPIEVLSQVPKTTKESYVSFKVVVPEGATHLLVRGPWNRDIRINGEKEIGFDVVLQKGEVNEITMLAYRHQEPDEEKGVPEAKLRSDVTLAQVKQTSKTVNMDALVEFLKSFKEQTLEEIQADEERLKGFIRCLEESSVRQFAGDFEEGRRYMRDLIENQKSAFLVKSLKKVLDLFERINAKQYPFIREGEGLLFFQKYCAYKINEKRSDGEKNVILANEPGLGKTVTALAAVYEDEMLAICPNSATSTWIEQEAKFFGSPFILDLAGHQHGQRPEMVKERNVPGILTNIEFLRTGDSNKAAPLSKEYKRRFDALNAKKFPRRKKALIIDEFHFLKNDSQQARGVELLKSDFALLMSASPYRSSTDLCRICARIFPDDPRFQNIGAFEKAFPKTDPRALKALYVMLQPYVVRFLKSEVMPTYVSGIPLAQQPLSLPKKEYVNPFETGIGLFTLTPEQETAILELFQDWNAWTRKYEHYMPKGEIARRDGIRDESNRLTKKHALRQIVNDPAYIGSSAESPKHKVARQILEKELAGGNKVIIFCRYHNQVAVYSQMLKEMGVKHVQFTGEQSKAGNMKNKQGGQVKYLVDGYDNYVFDKKGRPIVAKGDQSSKSMSVIDHERLSFQNDPEVKVCISTYSAGSQSVTFTAADAMIKDELPEDYTEGYQSEDRIHRVEDKRRKYEVRYYNLISRYSGDFLNEMAGTEIEKEKPNGEAAAFNAHERWFKNGTYDEVHHRNLEAQRTSFELLNNGIAVDPNIVETEQSFEFGD